MDALTIEIRPGKDEFGGTWNAVRLFVNGHDLIDLITEFEGERGYEPVGGYDAVACAPLDLLAALKIISGQKLTVSCKCVPKGSGDFHRPTLAPAPALDVRPLS